MRSSDLAYDRYRIDDFDEWMMGLSSPHAPPILFLPPLLEELNRTRRLLAEIMRSVAARGFCCWLPDLPGAGESERPLETIDWDTWRHAARAAAEQVARGGTLAAVASIRGGCLIDDEVTASCAWRFAPVAGASLIRDLNRAGLAAGGGSAGYDLAPKLSGPLERATPATLEPLRIVRLASDRGEADLKLEGPALWRRSEPETSPELAAPLAADLLTWVRTCGDS